MKKTFKGYSALIALLIALLVVTSMPMMAFADSDSEAIDESGDDHVVVFTIPIDGYGSQIHEARIGTIRIDRVPTCTEPGKLIFLCQTHSRPGHNVYHDVTLPAFDHFYASDGFYSTQFSTVPGAGTKNSVEDLKEKYIKYNLNGMISVPVAFDEKMGIIGDLGVIENDHWGQLVKDPTCTETGLAVDECVLCHLKVENGETRDIEEQHHWYDYYRKVDRYGLTTNPTSYVWELDADGNEMFGVKLAKIPTGPTKGFHVTKKPTCRTEGEAYFDCLRNGSHDRVYVTISIDEYAHVWDGWAIFKQATCAEKGERRHQCTLCGEKEYEFYGPLQAAWKVRRTTVIDCYHAEDTEYCANCEKYGTTTHKERKVNNRTRISHVFNTKNPYTIKSADNITVTVNGMKLDKWLEEHPYSPVTYDENMQMDVKYDLDVCTKPGKIVYMCVHYDDEAELLLPDGTKMKHEDDALALKTVTVPAREHQWGKWYRDFDSKQGGGDNKLAAWYRSCEYCGYTQQQGFAAGVDPNVSEQPVNPPVVNPSNPEPVEVVVPNKYAVDAAGVENGAGKAAVTVIEGTEDIDVEKTIFARVTWVYELSDGSSFAYAAMTTLKKTDDGFEVNVGGAMTPKGAKLVETQIALTDDADAYLHGEFHYIAGAVA